jgi:phage terminase small subunit
VSMAKKKPKKSITAKRVQATEDDRFIPAAIPQPENDEGPFDDGGLSQRQRAFVAAIVGPAGGIATKAAEMAGYASENRNTLYVTASRLLSNHKIQEAIAHEFAKLRATPEWAQNQLIDLATSSMAKFISFTDKGEVTIDWDKAAAAGALGQIKEYEEIPTKTGVRHKIKVHDRAAALAILLKLHGKLINRHEHTGANGGPITFDATKLTTDELRTVRAIHNRIAATSSN